MKKYILFTISVAALFASCGDKHQAAEQHLTNARNFLASQNFEQAKAEIDSINILYPRSFDQRKAGIALLDSIRKAENNVTITQAETLQLEMEGEVEKMKGDFLFSKDKKYQETGAYVPKLTGATGVLAYTTLHSGVEEDGRLYLESIFIGSQKHNKIKVSGNGQDAESLVVEGDGLVHRFEDLGKHYEVIRLTDVHDNGVAKFIAENADKSLKVTLTGGHTASYSLPQNIKNAIAKSYRLSSKMLQVDSLKTEKEKAEFKNFYLDNGKRSAIPVEEEQQQKAEE